MTRLFVYHVIGIIVAGFVLANVWGAISAVQKEFMPTQAPAASSTPNLDRVEIHGTITFDPPPAK